jgi:hypothetical protein
MSLQALTARVRSRRPLIAAATVAIGVGTLGAACSSIATATSLTTSTAMNVSVSGETVTLTATVTQKEGTVVPTGKVDFTNNGAALGSGPATLVNGKATLTTTDLPVGSDTVKAAYEGNKPFTPSFSSVTQSVYQTGTKTSLSADPPTSMLGTPVTFTARVATTNGTIPGAALVTFADGNTTVGTAPLDPAMGIAQVRSSTLSVGPHQITASYAGSKFSSAPSTSDALPVTVTQQPPPAP